MPNFTWVDSCRDMFLGGGACNVLESIDITAPKEKDVICQMDRKETGRTRKEGSGL